MKLTRYIPSARKLYLEQEKVRTYRVENLEAYKRKSKSFKHDLKPKLKKLGVVQGIDVWLVDGAYIRDTIDVDFTCGGHVYRYLYIPLNEIWIDNTLNRRDIRPTLWHEFIERHLMERGMDYGKAHTYACGLEIEIRRGREFFLPVVNFSQTTTYSCGAVALQIVLEYLGIHLTEKELIRRAKTTPEKGTDMKDMVAAAHALGFKTRWKQGWTARDVKKALDSGLPIIANFQLTPAFGEGHYAVIMGYTKTGFILSDPSSDETYYHVSFKEFMKNWYELEDKTRAEGLVVFR